nr:hypothetical protein [uncultured Muribaculum sp.]
MKNELLKEKSKDTDIDVKTIIIAIVAIVLFVAVIITIINIIEHFLIGILVFLVFGWVAIKTMCGL